jgi:hypothetical protein
MFLEIQLILELMNLLILLKDAIMVKQRIPLDYVKYVHLENIQFQSTQENVKLAPLILTVQEEP